MPSAVPPSMPLEEDVPQVSAMTRLLTELLDHARSLKPTSTIEPPLTKPQLDPYLAQLNAIFDADRNRMYAAVETAARVVFSSIVSATSIDTPEFVQVWNLFDVLSILSDSAQCDPALLFWLVEELLDSQTVDGCRKVFDFLESRRERITAKNLKQKSLVILRSCNDLLRRLSRAEDAAFCGRVYIFMFQSIPPGDRSSVNLRGEYHVENVTSFEDTKSTSAVGDDPMDQDTEGDAAKPESKENKSTSKAVSFDSKNASEPEKTLDTDALYPIFWSLQHFFSQPTTLFDAAELGKFKSGLEATLNAFQAVQKIQRSTKSSDDSRIIPQKRKISDGGEDLRSTNHNPKYLTSRDLFELEISDLYFRRHILIQAFIILDFLLSLTPQARAKIANVQQNRSVVYADKTLGEDDAKWAKSMKDKITTYIQQDTDGFFFIRVVESVISRDKGWVRWKVENCTPIERPSVEPKEFIEARSNAKRLATSRRPKTGMNSLSLSFMDVSDGTLAMESLRNEEKWKLPPLDNFQKKIANDDLDMDFAKDEKEKTQLLESKASKTWRAMRIARTSRLAALDKIDEWQKADILFQEPMDNEETEEKEEVTGQQPRNRETIILCGPPGAGKSTLVSMLQERQPGVFGRVIQHTTRSPKEWELDGQDFHFVDTKAFDTILDGDYFLEFSEHEDVKYGTSRKVVDTFKEANKVALVRLEPEGTQLAKDNGFSARVIHISPPSLEELKARLKNKNLPEVDFGKAVKAAELDMAADTALYQKSIVNDDLETAYKELEQFIYETPEVNGNGVHKSKAQEEEDTQMDG
ncbi:THO complex subunit 1 transcription elongation factor-domain-containing protein [Xylariaceae sp. FL1019]|nr:THO complex subunit 1 transcription elongation factor-domain-containing protein [Xylariaceae sp. FL1019]